MGLESGIQFAVGTGINYRQNRRALDLQQAQQDEMSAVRKAVEERSRRAAAAGEGENFLSVPGLFESLFPDAAPEEMRILRESFASNPVGALQDPNVLTARGRALEKYAPLWKQKQADDAARAEKLAGIRHPMQATDRESLARTQAIYKAIGDSLHQPFPQNPPIVPGGKGGHRLMTPDEWYTSAWDRAMSAANTIGDTAIPGRPMPQGESWGPAGPPPASPYYQGAPGGVQRTGPAARPPVRPGPVAPPAAAPAVPRPSGQTVTMRSPPAPQGDGKVYSVPLQQVPEAMTNGWKRVTSTE